VDEGFLIFISWWLALYVIGLAAASMAHEAGHLLCARICAIPVGLMVIGCGRVLMRRHVGATELQLRLVPLGGLVLPAAIPDLQRRWPLALFFVGGVLGNIAAIGAIIGLHSVGAVPTILHDARGVPLVNPQVAILAGTQVLLIIIALIPYSASFGGKPVASDGLQLLRLAFSRLPYAVRLQPYSGAATRLSLLSAASARISSQLARTDRWSDADARGEFSASLQRELAQDGLPAEEEMLVLDALVTDGLIFADPAVRPELDQWSLRALQVGPKVKTLIGSRGAVLVELGRYQEGKQLLETVAFSSDAAPFDALMSQVFLARAAHALGDAALANDLMTKARSAVTNPGAIGPAVMGLIERAEKEIHTQQ